MPVTVDTPPCHGPMPEDEILPPSAVFIAEAPRPLHLGVLRALRLGLVGRDDDVGGDEEGAVLGGGDHVVRGVPDAVVQRVPVGRDGL